MPQNDSLSIVILKLECLPGLRGCRTPGGEIPLGARNTWRRGIRPGLQLNKLSNVFSAGGLFSQLGIN